MITYQAPIADSTITIRPSETLYRYISKISIALEELPPGIYSILSKSKKSSTYEDKNTHKYLLTSKDYETIKSLENKFEEQANVSKNTTKKNKVVDKVLRIHDLRWLYEHIKQENKKNTNKIYLHELLEGSDILLPKNEEIPRSPELEKRCERLRIDQENRRYMNMTKNVDNVRKKMPEDTLGYQLKEMNKQLIAIFQFLVSVVAGFAFGFMGIEVFVGALDFGFKLLLGIIFALIIALAELYFLAKKLNEEYVAPEVSEGKTKMD